MGRSQRHILVEHNATSAGEIIAQGEVAPASLQQAYVVPEGAPQAAEPRAIDDLVVPEGDPGGPLSGSTMTGAIPEDILVPPEPEYGPEPTITSLLPETAVLNDPDVEMHVHGTNFTEESVIYFANQPEPIVFYSSEDISTRITLSLPWGPATVPVWVQNGDEKSNEVSFTFTEAPPPPEPEIEE